MKPADLTGILVLAFLGGGILTFLVAIIKYFNLGDILNGFDEKKHDKEKVSINKYEDGVFLCLN